MSPIAGSSENLLKSRSLKLVPKMCIAIGFVRQTSSSAGSPSSMSVSSDQPQCDHYELNGTASRFSGGMTPKSPPTTRQFTFGEQSTGSTPSDSTASPPQSSPVDRQSFSSFSTGTTTTYNRECLCQQSINCAQLFSEFVRENLLNTCFVLPTNSFSKIDIAGFLYPCTLLVSGQADSLKLLCSLWSRRILKAPLGYSIRFLGKSISTFT